jgi:Peptidase A4 family
VQFETAFQTARPEPEIPGAERGWAPTIVLCLVLLLGAVAVLVAKPLSAGASPTRAHGRAHAHRSSGSGRNVQAVPTGTTDGATSPNWSGYVAYPSAQYLASPSSSAYDGTFTQVSADWIQPSVTCPQTNAWTLFWVGFDGWPSSDAWVEQGGTSARCVKGVPQYSAFYEMWPTGAVTPMFTVKPGDQISASVVYTATTNQFLITVTDVTSGQTQTEVESCASATGCPRTSVEWVAESPSFFGTNTWFPLADYGTIEFTSATATDNRGVAGPIADASQWVDSGIERNAGPTLPLGEAGPLQNSGYVFRDTWKHR